MGLLTTDDTDTEKKFVKVGLFSVILRTIAVLNELKPGLDEKLYENALVVELAARGHTLEQQREYPVHYRGH
jgi:GxxExxY protein